MFSLKKLTRHSPTFYRFSQNVSHIFVAGNDCGALKAAHVGIALSDAEASTVAPFTSLDKTISATLGVLREGRCSLASSLASYKFMIMYGQIATINQLINAYLATSFTEWCWVFMDGIWVMTLAFSLPLAKAASSLAQTWPTASLLGPQTLASVLGIMAINFGFLVGALSYLWHQDWFQVCSSMNDQMCCHLLALTVCMASLLRILAVPHVGQPGRVERFGHWRQLRNRSHVSRHGLPVRQRRHCL
jgi:magnesium-transporting ATPase (P-type)